MNMNKVSKLPFKKKLALELHRKYVKNSRKLHHLNYIFWECTLRCNMSCLHCGSDCKKSSDVDDMPVNDFIAAIDNIKDIVVPNKTMIVLTGGEPLMRKDIEQCGKKLYERGFPWGIVTNGLYLSPERLESLVNSGMRAITISLDGFSDTHNWLRGNSYSFAQAKEAIKLISRVPDLIFDVVTCVNKRNFLELDELRDMLISEGVNNWRIFSISPIGRGNLHPDLKLSPIQLNSLMHFIKQTRLDDKIKLNYGCQGFLGNFEGEVRDNLFFCKAGVNVASVLADGSISACPNINRSFAQGNIYSDSFKEVWQNKFQIYRNRKWMKTGACIKCKFFRYCEGNGFHLRDENGELLFCHLKDLSNGEPIIE